jgi:endonuclease/exonuclease/phosphatase (EEP) superfamily protein YafD
MYAGGDMMNPPAFVFPKVSMKRLLSRFFTLLIALYGIGITLFLLGRWLVGETITVDIINRFVALLLMPALVLLMIPAAWTFGVYFAPLFLPNASPPPDAPRLTLATYNLGARTDGIEALIANIRAVDADIIGLQEVSQQAADQISTALAQQYPYMALYPREQSYQGTGLLSKLPIVEDYAYPHAPGGVYGRLRMQRAQIEFEGTRIMVFNFHAQPTTESWREPDVMVRREQVWQLVEEAEQVDGPRIITGDFNLNEQSIEYRRITEQFKDAYHEAGWGMGFTGPVWADLEEPPISREILMRIPPHRRIDFVFYDAAFQATRAEVWPRSSGSDHMPLVAELAYVYLTP